MDNPGAPRRILLISPIYDPILGMGDTFAPSLGVWRLKACVEASGHLADVWDPSLETRTCDPADRAGVTLELLSQLESRFRLASYDWFGFSMLHVGQVLSLGLANLLRRRYPDVRHVAGNAEATLNFQDVFLNSSIDCVLMGEADLSLPLLLGGADPREIPGCLWFTRGERQTAHEMESAYDHLDFSTLPILDYALRIFRVRGGVDPSVSDDLLRRIALGEIADDRASDLLRLPASVVTNLRYEAMTVRIVTMDHCSHSCTFCSTARIPLTATGRHGRSVLLPVQSVQKLALRIKREVPGVLGIYDDSDEAFLSTSRGLEFARALQEIRDTLDAGTPAGFRWHIQTRSDDMTRELVHELARGGVTQLTFGIESGSERVRASLGKRQNARTIDDLAGWCAETGITCCYMLILFTPESTVAELEETLEHARRWTRGGVSVSAIPYMVPYRGTALSHAYATDAESLACEIPFAVKNSFVQVPILVQPRDSAVRAIFHHYRSTMKPRSSRETHHKGRSARDTLDHLESCIAQWKSGAIPSGNGGHSADDR